MWLSSRKSTLLNMSLGAGIRLIKGLPRRLDRSNEGAVSILVAGTERIP
jgi:hypothetical protein